MGGQHGYSEIKKLCFLGLAIGLAMKEASEQTGVRRVAPFVGVVDDALEVLGIDRAEAQKQWDEMDDADWDALVTDCQNEFTLEDADLEARVEKAFAGAMKMVQGAADVAEAVKG